MTLTRTGGDCVGNESSRSGALFFCQWSEEGGELQKCLFLLKNPVWGKERKEEF